MNQSRQLQTFFLLILLSFPIRVLATGYSDPVNIGPRAIGMGGAFVGIADDPTAIYHNPAAIGLLKGHQLSIGFDNNFTNFQFTPPGGTKESSKQEFRPAPYFFYTKDLSDIVTAGIGVYFPHGSVVKYSGNSANPLNPNEVNLYTMEITPTIAINSTLIKGLSIGGGLRIVRISSKIINQGFVLSTTPLFIDNLETVDLSGWTVGGVASAFYQPIDAVSFGVVYRTVLRKNVEGDGTFSTLGDFSGSVSQTIPAMLTTGVGIYPTAKLKIGLSYDFEQNSQNSNITVSADTFPQSLELPVAWKDSHTVHVGLNYQWTDMFNSSLGYARDLNASIPDFASDRGNTDFDSHFVSAGIGFDIKKLEINAAWKVFLGDNDIPNDGFNPIPGKYEIVTHTVSLGANYRFE